jgi:hypothetical protein
MVNETGITSAPEACATIFTRLGLFVRDGEHAAYRAMTVCGSEQFRRIRRYLRLVSPKTLASSPSGKSRLSEKN